MIEPNSIPTISGRVTISNIDQHRRKILKQVMMVIAGSSAPATLLSAPNRQLRILSWPDYFPP
ncbi:MAG TPA: hypothetical protein QF550_03895, partial [Arenicellales bacterium]|nr:hypothetical protein [Arenicellales bacterium]